MMYLAAIIQKKSKKDAIRFKAEQILASPHALDTLEQYILISISSDRSTNLANTSVSWQKLLYRHAPTKA